MVDEPSPAPPGTPARRPALAQPKKPQMKDRGQSLCLRPAPANQYWKPLPNQPVRLPASEVSCSSRQELPQSDSPENGHSATYMSRVWTCKVIPTVVTDGIGGRVNPH